MRSRDDLRRQARTLSLANDADRGEPQLNGLTATPVSGEVRQTVRGPGPEETVCKLGLGRRSRVFECYKPERLPGP